MPDSVTLVNPGPVTISETTGNEVAGPSVSTRTRAYLSQRPVENLSSNIEMRGGQDTVISLWTLLVPPGAPLRADTTVIDDNEHRYEVEGAPAARRSSPRPGAPVIYQAAALRRISDLEAV